MQWLALVTHSKDPGSIPGSSVPSLHVLSRGFVCVLTRYSSSPPPPPDKEYGGRKWMDGCYKNGMKYDDWQLTSACSRAGNWLCCCADSGSSVVVQWEDLMTRRPCVLYSLWCECYWLISGTVDVLSATGVWTSCEWVNLLWWFR